MSRFDSMRYMKKYICRRCSKSYSKEDRWQGKYCSRDCRFKSKFTGRMVICKHCGNGKWREKSYIKNNYFCGSECFFKYKRENGHGRINVTEKLKLKILEKYDYTCAYCKNKKHQVMMPLQFHHLDGNVRNTVLKNLVPLCVSCHRKTQRNIPLKRYISETFTVNL